MSEPNAAEVLAPMFVMGQRVRIERVLTHPAWKKNKQATRLIARSVGINTIRWNHARQRFEVTLPTGLSYDGITGEQLDCGATRIVLADPEPEPEEAHTP